MRVIESRREMESVCEWENDAVSASECERASETVRFRRKVRERK